MTSFTYALKRKIKKKNCVYKQFRFEFKTNLLNNFAYSFSSFYF